MILTDSWTGLLMPKTGTRFFLNMATKYAGAEDRKPHHGPACAIPAGRSGLVVGMTREPCRWLTSWYIQCRNASDTTRDRMAVYGGGSLEFEDVIEGVTRLRAGRIPEQPIGFASLVGDRRQGLLESRGGLWSWMHRYMFGDADAWEGGEWSWAVDMLIPTSRVYEGLQELGLPATAQVDPPVGTAIQRRGYDAPNKVHPPSDYRTWWTDDLVSQVYAADATLISVFGFEPFEPAPKPFYRLDR